LWFSYRTCSFHWTDLHPNSGRKSDIEQDPINHIVLANAIIRAFSAIEELNLHVVASHEKPIKVGGVWNSLVLKDLCSRLENAGVDTSKPFLWNLRNSPTRIEKAYPPPDGEPTPWTRFWVRDRMVKITDAIHYAGILRSRVSAHRVSDRTRSLTLYDVDNVQSLARRLILESLGFWTPD
jgi:hypothetical protein